MDKLYSNIGDISENHYNYLMNLENVNGVGYGSKHINNKNTFEPCIHVLVEKKKDNKYLTQNNIIPKKYMGIKTDVIEVGKISVNSSNNFRDNSDLNNESLKKRPLQGGANIGTIGDLAYGTMCCIVRRKIKIKIKISNSKEYKYNYVYYVLSNNHVLADNNKNPIGITIVQPVSFSKKDSVAMLLEYIPIKFYNKFNVFAYNKVDCAIARVLKKSFISNEVIGLGKIKGVTEAVENMKIKKSGAETGITQGSVDTLNTTILIESYDGKKRLLYKKQIIGNIVSAAGDSGSPILTQDDNKLIGMHHAYGKDFTVINDINLVLKKLKVEVYLGEE